MVQAHLLTEIHRDAKRFEGTALRDYTTRSRSALIEELDVPGRGGVALARKHAQIADRLIRTIFEPARAKCSDLPLLLGAVGGYGRGLLALGSDLDLCFVTTASREAVADCVDAMLYPLWDAGIQVGHQIVHPAEVSQDAAEDLSLATELLDFRPLAGDLYLQGALKERLYAGIFSNERIGAFVGLLESGALKRHEKYGDSVYLLEPDVKNGAGGLRDLDSALWATRARFGTNQLAELSRAGVITEKTQEETERAVDFLWTVRNHLHRISGRKTDRLTFAEQERVAAGMGYARTPAEGEPHLKRIGEMVEAFMSDYYRHARVVARTRARLLGRAKRGAPGSSPAVVPLGDGLVECDGNIGLSEPDEVQRKPSLAFRVYAFAVARGKPVLSRTRDAIAAATSDAETCARLREDKDATRTFVQLLCSSSASPFSSGSILTELHDVGLLLAMIPEFAPVVGRVHHDLYHVYTVDVHSIAAVDKLHELVRGDWTKQYPLASRIAAESVRRRVLFMATLLHDIGKAIGGRDHAKRGAEMAKEILARLHYTREEIEEVSLLILHHLTMYMVAIRRDLNDPATVSEFVRDNWDRESLRELFLLTIADVATTSNQSMTAWKRHMLSTLFRSADSHLDGSLSVGQKRVTRIRERVKRHWDDPSSLEDLGRFLESMPERYFLANSPEEVAAHAKLALKGGDQAFSVSWMPSHHHGIVGLCVVAEAREHLDVCVVADDRPGLLASIAAAISAGKFDITAAQINSRRLVGGGYQALDLFWLRCPENEEVTERRLAKLKADLSAVIRGEVAPEVLVQPRLASRRRLRPAPPVPTEILFDHHASDEYTVIEVLAEDRPALLFTLCRALRELGIVIGVAKISTEGTRAVDVLYASESDGSKIQPGTRSDEVREKLVAALQATAPI